MSRHVMSRHVSLEILASYAEGELKPRKAAKIAVHLAGCAVCSEQVQDLRLMPSLLSSVQFPPIPEHLSVRIEMAIVSESVQRVASQPVSGEASRRDLPARAGGQPRRRGWRVPGFSSPLAGSLAAVGAAVIIAGGGYEIASNLGNSAGTSGAPSEAHLGPKAQNGASGATGQVRYGPAVPYRHNGHAGVAQSVETNTNFEPATLSSQAQAEWQNERTDSLKSSQQSLTSPFASAAPAVPGGAGQLRGCVNRIAAGRNVLFLDIARYQGKRATIIVVGTQASRPAVLYAVGEGCSAMNSDILAQRNLPHLSP